MWFEIERLFSSGSLAPIRQQTAATDAIDGNVSDEYIPFSDLRPRFGLNSYIRELKQNDYEEQLTPKHIAQDQSKK